MSMANNQQDTARKVAEHYRTKLGLGDSTFVEGAPFSPQRYDAWRRGLDFSYEEEPAAIQWIDQLLGTCLDAERLDVEESMQRYGYAVGPNAWSVTEKK